MSLPFPFPRAAAALLAATVLSACAGDGRPPRCPDPVVLREAGRLVEFRDAGRDLTDVRFEAQILDVALGCEIEEDDGKRTVEAELQLLFQAEKGPANDSGEARFTYFVAVADRSDNVLARQTFDLTMPLRGNQTQARGTDVLEPTIPLKEGDTGASYVVYVGFDLTRDQLEYNRRNPL